MRFTFVQMPNIGNVINYLMGGVELATHLVHPSSPYEPCTPGATSRLTLGHQERDGNGSLGGMHPYLARFRHKRLEPKKGEGGGRVLGQA